MQTAPDREEMVQAFLQADDSYDGSWFSGVRGTGVFCKPSCRANGPNIKNPQFFPNARDALRAGFRPCLRCKPLLGHSSPEWLANLLYAVEHEKASRLTDKSLRQMGLEPRPVRQYFLERFGMTFHAYARAHRLATAFTQIREGADLDGVVFDSGCESPSRFRSASGKPPATSRGTILISWIETPIGTMVAGATRGGICLLEFTDRKILEKQMASIRSRFHCSTKPGSNQHIDLLRAELAEYFEGKRNTFTVRLEMSGTEFQERVWRLLCQIPYGQTWSYEELARRTGNPAAVRAVARANGMNRIAILIPCHRVMNKNGQLGGYGGGLWRKTALLELEAGRINRQVCVQSA